MGGFDDLTALLEELVAAVSVPAATHPSVTVALAPPWELVPGSVTAGLAGSSVGDVTADGFTWSRANLGNEHPVITYRVKHVAAPCGPLGVNSSVVYHDDENASVAFPPVVVTVVCVPPVADAGPTRPTPVPTTEQTPYPCP